MGNRYHDLLFTPAVKAAQTAMGSRAHYEKYETPKTDTATKDATDSQADDRNNALTASEATFITLRDSFYMASVTETGWPYVQHRGGPQGFVKVFDPNTIGFADFAGNRQYISLGSLLTEDRVSLFFMDYPNRARLKLLGRVKFFDANSDELLRQLVTPDYRARVERGVIIKVEAFEWNCPQHITPRIVDREASAEITALKRRIVELEQALAQRDTSQ